MAKIIYIRHGQASVFSDNYDKLSDLGHKQAHEVGKFLLEEGIQIDNLYVGPLQRHKETAQGIRKGMELEMNEIELEGLREHQGFSVLKRLLPQLIEQDLEIRNLVNMPWKDRSEQIKHHMRIYENFSLRWAKGEFDHMTNGEFQNWKEFESAAGETFKFITDETSPGTTSLVVTSGGPKAIACGKAMDLDIEKIIRASWVIYNCSISEFLVNEERSTLSTFNNISFLRDKSYRTLV